MRHITITLQLAFFDHQQRTADNIANQLINDAVDGLHAEIAYTSTRGQADHPLADPGPDGDEGDWQEKAREIMETT